MTTFLALLSRFFRKRARIACQPVNDHGSVFMNANVFWDEDRGLSRRWYHVLKDKTEDTVIESRRLWGDKPFSILASPSSNCRGLSIYLGFGQYRQMAGMRVVLEHSIRIISVLLSSTRKVKDPLKTRALLFGVFYAHLYPTSLCHPTSIPTPFLKQSDTPPIVLKSKVRNVCPKNDMHDLDGFQPYQ